MIMPTGKAMPMATVILHKLPVAKAVSIATALPFAIALLIRITAIAKCNVN